MRKNRRPSTTKVWHNPDIAPVADRKRKPAAERPTPASPRATPAPAPSTRQAARIVAVKPEPTVDPRELEREKLLAKLVAAEGPTKVARAAAELHRAGFELPLDEDVHLALLEHSDEERVRGAIDTLGALYREKAPKRRGMLEARLRRIEEMADEAPTRAAAERLRRAVSGRGEAP